MKLVLLVLLLPKVKLVLLLLMVLLLLLLLLPQPKVKLVLLLALGSEVILGVRGTLIIIFNHCSLYLVFYTFFFAPQIVLRQRRLCSVFPLLVLLLPTPPLLLLLLLHLCAELDHGL